MVSAASRVLQKHITKCLEANSNYAAKTLLVSAISLDFCSNIADSIQLGKNKELKPKQRNYLSAFQLTNGFVSASAQAAVGFAVISKKAQNFITKKLSKLSLKFAETLKDSTAKQNLMKLSSLIAAVVITKRILVPFITTPIASWLKKKRENDRTAKQDKTVENIFEEGKYKLTYDYD